ncbi:hypothetical protein [Streptomyces subrutilus]|uniref:hypothetical protein n=1 Tax=Streptomyces subrutilus TaxID=36818 RepID=UPI003F4DAEB4
MANRIPAHSAAPPTHQLDDPCAAAPRRFRRRPPHGPRRGLLLAVAGYGTAAATTLLPLVVAGSVAGGFGSGTATAVAASGIDG